MIQNIKDFIFECLLFGKPLEGHIIKNWILAVFAWLNIFVIILRVISIINKVL